MSSTKDMNYDDAYLRAISDHRVLTREEERDLLVRYHVHKDAKAREDMVHYNMRLILSCAQRYYASTDPRLIELVSAGSLGMFTAIDRFDIRKLNDEGTFIRFSTFAVWWILAAIRTELKISTQRSPKNKAFKKQSRELKLAFKKQLLEFRKKFKYTPNEEVIMDSLQWTAMERAIFEASTDRKVVSLDQIADVLTEDVLDDSSNLAEPAVGDIVIESLKKLEEAECLHEALRNLPAIQQDIIRSRYQIGREAVLTYADLSDIYMCTQEQIRQLENKGLKQLYVWLRKLEECE